LGLIVVSVDQRAEPVERIIDPAQLASQCRVVVEGFLGSPVAFGVKRVLDPVAEIVGDGGQAMC
jgi:hypothetical protein